MSGYRLISAILQKERVLGSSGPCQVNINCPEGADWQSEKKAVAMILVGGICEGLDGGDDCTLHIENQTLTTNQTFTNACPVIMKNITVTNGAKLKEIRISQRGEGTHVIYGSEFSPGVYLYALFADNRQVDVKKMVLSK